MRVLTFYRINTNLDKKARETFQNEKLDLINILFCELIKKFRLSERSYSLTPNILKLMRRKNCKSSKRKCSVVNGVNAM